MGGLLAVGAIGAGGGALVAHQARYSLTKGALIGGGVAVGSLVVLGLIGVAAFEGATLANQGKGGPSILRARPQPQYLAIDAPGLAA